MTRACSCSLLLEVILLLLLLLVVKLPGSHTANRPKRLRNAIDDVDVALAQLTQLLLHQLLQGLRWQGVAHVGHTPQEIAHIHSIHTGKGLLLLLLLILLLAVWLPATVAVNVWHLVQLQQLQECLQLPDADGSAHTAQACHPQGNGLG
jgi:hypothetical protein